MYTGVDTSCERYYGNISNQRKLSKLCVQVFVLTILLTFNEGHLLWWGKYHICIQVQCTFC